MWFSFDVLVFFSINLTLFKSIESLSDGEQFFLSTETLETCLFIKSLSIWTLASECWWRGRKSNTIFTHQGIVISYLYTILWQKSLSKSCAWRCWWFIVIVCQPIRSFQSPFSGYSIFTFHFNKEHVLFTQWEIVCYWFHMMLEEPIK